MHLRSLSLLAVPLLAATTVHGQWSTDTLSSPRGALTGVVHGQKAYIAGGRTGTIRSDVVDIYDDASGTWSQAFLAAPRDQLAAVAVGPYVLFAGGADSPTTSSKVVDYLDTTSMTWHSAEMLSYARFALAAVAVGSKAIFAGGGEGDTMAPVASDVVDVYDASLGAPDDPLAWSSTILTVPRGAIAATTVGTRAFFAGGLGDVTTHATVDVYDDATGTWSTASLFQARVIGTSGAATIGSRAYFAGGRVASGGLLSDVVDVYDADLDAWSHFTLPAVRGFVTAASLGDLLLLAGGLESIGGSSAVSDRVDVVETGTGAHGTSRLTVARYEMATLVLGNRALFAGGLTAPFAGSGRVDVFECLGASVSLYAGDGINADTIAPVPIVLGQSWNAPLTIGHPHGAGGPTQLKVRTGVINGANVTSPIGGRPTEVLISGPLLLALSSSHDGATGDVPTVTVPPILDLVGAFWAAQYVVVGGGHADLSQAVQGTIGCF
jgi:hypothetical protein